MGAIHLSGTYAEGQKLTLSNRYLDWDLVMTGGTIKSTGFRNRLTGRYYELSDSKELVLTFSQARRRVEIPWWNYELGSENDHSLPDQEAGYLRGYHREDFRGEEKWKKTLNLLIRGSSWIEAPAVFNGYAWFRQQFELPREAEGQAIVFCLGGYTQEDWNQYWVFLNGKLIGNWRKSGRWRTPEELTLRPGSREYSSLRFGIEKKNLLAVRTFQSDKRFAGLTDEVLDRFTFDGHLCDQFLAVGQPCLHLSDFKLKNWDHGEEGETPKYVFELVNTEEQLQVTLHFELDEFVRRKWLEIKNLGVRERLLLDVDVDDFRVEAPMTEGDYGQPLIVGEELFCAIEHPAGVNQGMAGRVRLLHFPGKRLAPGASLRSRTAIVGVAPLGQGRQQFIDYIQARSPRKKLLSIYDPFGINGYEDSPCWTLNDDEMLEMLDLLESWQKAGIKFDYFNVDVGWQDSTGKLKEFWPQCFPEGPAKVIKRVNKLGMKWGLWFAASSADWSCGLNPEIEPSRTVVPGGKWPEYLYRDNFNVPDERFLCLASEPYFSMLRDALLYHVREYNLRSWKLDEGVYYCNSTEHSHLPGKYSTEANYDAVIDIAKATRQARPEIFIMWYWGIRSPFFALYGDSLSDQRITLEAASTSDYPALFFRDSVTLAMDQGAQFAEFIPPMNKDSLGVWVSDDPSWANALGKERWREALVMDLGRGSLLFPQIWGDLFKFNQDDIAFMSRLQKLAKDHELMFYRRKTILGDPWKNEVYGYAYFQGAHGFIFVNNVDFQSRPIRLKLDEMIGLTAPEETPLHLVSHFPERAWLRVGGQHGLKTGQTLETWLRPFEVALWEIAPAVKEREPSTLNQRELVSEKPEVNSQRLELEAEPPGPGMEIHFGEQEPYWRSPAHRPTLEEFTVMGYHKRILAGRAKLPDLASRPHVLAVVLRMRKDGKWWRYSQPVDLIQAKATIGDQSIIRFETVPNYRQAGSWQQCPWLVFKIRTSAAWSGKELCVALNAYLPPEVDVQVEGWVVPQWW